MKARDLYVAKRTCLATSFQVLPFLYQTHTIRRGFTRSARLRLGEDVVEGPSSLIRRIPTGTDPFPDRHGASGQTHNVQEFSKPSDVQPTIRNRDSVAIRRTLADERCEHVGRDTALDPKSLDFVPFDRIPDPIQDALRGSSTLTESERETFQRLRNDLPLRLADGAGLQQSAQVIPMRRQQEAQRVESGLDAVLDDALRDAQTQAEQVHPRQTQISAAKQDRQDTKRSTKNKRHSTRETEPDRRRHSKLALVKAELNAATTDFEVWKVFRRSVIAPVVAMNLDQPHALLTARTPVDQLARPNRRTFHQQDSEMAVVGRELHELLLHTIRALRKQFPTSMLIHSIIPELQQAGPSAFALGASTPLYNEVLKHMSEQLGDIAGMQELLSEMEREVIQPDRETQSIIVSTLRQAKDITHSMRGPSSKLVWNTDRMKRSLVDLRLHARRVTPYQQVAVGDNQ